MTRLIDILLAFLITLALLSPKIAHSKEIRIDDLKMSGKRAYLTSEINDDIAGRFEDTVDRVKSMNGPLFILINSNGGFLHSGNRIINKIKELQKERTEIICVVYKGAASMAFNILSNCDKRYAYENALLLAHKARITLAKGSTYTAIQLHELADELEKDDAPFREANAKAMHLTLEQYDKYADKETLWRATTLHKMGYFDAIIIKK